jgi:hypothetical protein
VQRASLTAVTCGLTYLGITAAYGQQYPIMERVANRAIETYQSSSCQQLAAQRAQRPAGRRQQVEQQFIQTLHQDPQMREAFINRVAAPIANKLFECGLIP